MGVAADDPATVAPGSAPRRRRGAGGKLEGPGGDKLGDVVGSDLIERRILGAREIARVIGPIARGNLGGHWQGDRQKQNTRAAHELCSIST